MTRSLSEDYLRWLEPQIRDKQSDQGRTYWDLLRIMFNTEFVPLVPYDDNRAADGLALRSDFCFRRDIPLDSLNDIGPASFLEVLIGLSRRLEFAASGEARGWARQLLGNLDLLRYNDPLSHNERKKVSDILEVCIQRTYHPSGKGGFFPLAWSDEDQRKIELWYQMAAYIDELHPEY